MKSQNGGPASKIRAEIGIESFPVPGTKIKLACAKAVAPLLVGFAAEFHELIEPIDEGGLDDWGYCFRMVRGSTDNLSNHSSGTAIDLNATEHPLGKVGTFPAEKVPMIKALAKKYSLLPSFQFVNLTLYTLSIVFLPLHQAVTWIREG